MRRRKFIKFISVGSAGLTTPLFAPADTFVPKSGVGEMSPSISLPKRRQTWLGSELWANRLQDWRVSDTRIECLEGGASFEVRTVALLTRFLSTAAHAGRVRCKLGIINPSKKGFAGFWLGIGAGELDYRGAALAQRAPGTNGGLMATVDDVGTLSLIDFSTPTNPLSITRLKATASKARAADPKAAEWMLDCSFSPDVTTGRYTIEMTLYNAQTKRALSMATYKDIAPHFLSGGISLVSSPNIGVDGARWWFSDIQTGGKKVAVFPERALSPVVGCMHSLDAANNERAVLKLTSQLFPLALDPDNLLLLEVAPAKSRHWRTVASSKIADGYVGLFRVENWDARKQWRYRLRFNGVDTVLYDGKIGRGVTTSKPLSVALFSCILPTAKSLDLIDYKKLIPQEQEIGRYTKDNILFPHSRLVSNCENNDPDIYLFCGDQYYETYPTRPGRHAENGKLDTLYRWYLWLWTFREALRDKPCLVLADDHDVLQGNLWGNAGLDSDDNKEESGGFKWDKDLVRMIYRVQHSHNPDSYDDALIAHNIPVSYGSFVYRGVDFAFIEDRKFKSPPDYDTQPLTVSGELLGAQQEQFLAHWAKNKRGLPKVCVTASMWGSPQTGADGAPLLDYDANGYPPDGRDSAVQLVANAKALVLAGDQHLGMVAHQGLENYDDGALFFLWPGRRCILATLV